MKKLDSWEKKAKRTKESRMSCNVSKYSSTRWHIKISSYWCYIHTFANNVDKIISSCYSSKTKKILGFNCFERNIGIEI
ncbi:hypothetical protein HYD52_02675 [Mycoplasmopsis bovis]|nr:hypothetical protein [Mycoplasmopsis bovis]QQH72333.1 hypothetical protein HYD52_02675 [Mycoplasmopsis bovis]